MYLRLKSHTRGIISVWYEAPSISVFLRDFKEERRKPEKERAVVIPRAACIDAKKEKKQKTRKEKKRRRPRGEEYEF